MEVEGKAPKVRILSGSPAKVEAEVNLLLGSYVPTVWNIQPGADGPLVSCILVHESEIRKAQLAMAQGFPMSGQRPRGM
jgi:hypothetical protein